MRDIVPFEAPQLDQLIRLVNVHLSAVVPGWGLSAPFLARHLERNPGEFVVDPWVAERVTFVAVERDRVVAAAHVQRFEREGDRVGDGFRGTGAIDWLVGWPSAADATAALLERCLRQLDAWAVEPRHLLTGGLYLPSLSGVPDTWPHVAAVLRGAGLEPTPEHTECLYAGWLTDLSPPEAPPLDGLQLRRRAVDNSLRFGAMLDGEEIGWCDVEILAADDVQALAGWVDLWWLAVGAEHRGRGVGSWLVRAAVPWLRLAGCDRMLAVLDVNHEGSAGEGRFYERLGWHPIVTLERAWRSSSSSQ